MKTDQTVTISGWSHLGCGPWTMVLTIPHGWRLVTNGRPRDGDMCAVGTAAAIRRCASRRKLARGQVLKGQWEPIEPDNLQLPLCKFRAIIRRSRS